MISFEPNFVQGGQSQCRLVQSSVLADTGALPHFYSPMGWHSDTTGEIKCRTLCAFRDTGMSRH